MAADVNRDGRPDLIVANYLSRDVSVLLGNGFGGFGSATNYAAGLGALAVAATDAITVDLVEQRITTPFQDRFDFTVDPFRRACLLDGLDDIALTSQHADAIAAHDAALSAAAPWARTVRAMNARG